MPVFIIGIDISVANNLDIASAGTMLDRFDLAKQNSLLLHVDTFTKSQNSKGSEKKNKDDYKTLIYLLPILITLIIVLVILYLKSSVPTSRKVPVVPVIIPTIRINNLIPSPTLFSEPISSPSASLPAEPSISPDISSEQPKS